MSITDPDPDADPLTRASLNLWVASGGGPTSHNALPLPPTRPGV